MTEKIDAKEDESQKVIAALEGQGFYNFCLREDGSGNDYIVNHRADDVTDEEIHKSNDSCI